MFTRLSFLFIVLLHIALNHGLQTNNFKRVCYYTNWSQYRPEGGKFLPEDIDPYLCTHIVYAFAKLNNEKGNGNRITNVEWNDDDTPWSKGMYSRVNSIKLRNPNVKTLLAIGGWTQGTEPISVMASVKARRDEFVNSTIGYLRSRGFDGLEIDWQYPTTAEDKNNLPLLLKELYAGFLTDARLSGQDRLLISLGAPAGQERINAGYKIEEANKYVDFINIMSYDFHGSWETKTGHHSSLFRGDNERWYAAQLNVDWAVRKWIREGASRDKLIVGIPMYGRGYSLEYKYQNGIGAMATGGSTKGKYLREAGLLAYYEICTLLKQGATVHWLPKRQVPYLVHNSDWVGYDNVRSVVEKTKWTMRNGYGGVMVWSLDQDDFTGMFCGTGRRYPLITAINQTLNGENLITSTVATSTLKESPTTLSSSSLMSTTASAKMVENQTSTTVTSTKSIETNKNSETTAVVQIQKSSTQSGISKFTTTTVPVVIEIAVTPKPVLQKQQTKSTTSKVTIETTKAALVTTARKNTRIVTPPEFTETSTVLETNSPQTTPKNNDTLNQTTSSDQTVSVVKFSQYFSSISKDQVPTTISPPSLTAENEASQTKSSFTRRKLLQFGGGSGDPPRSGGGGPMNGFGSVLNSLFNVISEFSGGPRPDPPRSGSEQQRPSRQSQRGGGSNGQRRQRPSDNTLLPNDATPSMFDLDPPRTGSRERGSRRIPTEPSVTVATDAVDKRRRNRANRRQRPGRNNNGQGRGTLLRDQNRRRRPIRPNGTRDLRNPATPNETVPRRNRMNRRRFRNRMLMRNRNRNPENRMVARNSVTQRSLNRNGLNRGEIRDSFFSRIRESEPSLLQEPFLNSMDIPSLERALGLSGPAPNLPPTSQTLPQGREINGSMPSLMRRRPNFPLISPRINRFRRPSIIPQRDQFRQISSLESFGGNSNASLLLIPVNNLDQTLQQVVSSAPRMQIRNITSSTSSRRRLRPRSQPTVTGSGQTAQTLISRPQNDVMNPELSVVPLIQPQSQPKIISPRGPPFSILQPPRRASVSDRQQTIVTRTNVQNGPNRLQPVLGPLGMGRRQPFRTQSVIMQNGNRLEQRQSVPEISATSNRVPNVQAVRPVVQIPLKRQNVLNMPPPQPTNPPQINLIVPTPSPFIPRQLADIVPADVSRDTFISGGMRPKQNRDTLVIQLNPGAADRSSVATGTILNGERQGQTVNIVEQKAFEPPPPSLNQQKQAKENALQTPLEVIQELDKGPKQTQMIQPTVPPVKISTKANNSKTKSIPKSEVLWKWEVK